MRISDWSSDVCSSDLRMRAAQVACPYPGRQAELGVVSKRQDFLFVAEWRHRQHGPEHLFLHDRVIGLQVMQDGGLKEKPLLQARHLGTLAAIQDRKSDG